jgi:glutathione-specific gamma-glutamylcyclotransferase
MLQLQDITCDWVFAYGSLIWSPEIDYAERRAAKLYGYHRSFCINSTRYRGTTERPGAVLGLDRGGSCMGVAYRLHTDSRQSALRQIYRREIPDPKQAVYRAHLVSLVLGKGDQPHPDEACADGEKVLALTFLADRRLPSYIRLGQDQLVQRLAQSDGERGRNCDYAINTWNSLRDMGFEDRKLTRVIKQLQGEIQATAPKRDKVGSA